MAIADFFIGVGGGVLGDTIFHFLLPLISGLGEAAWKKLADLINRAFSKVPPGKITKPETYVVVPLLYALAYSLDSEILRELYANLLESAMTIDKKSDVHPSFVEVIKQMSPLDAQVFQTMSQTTDWKYGLMKLSPGGKRFVGLFANLPITINNLELYAVSISNLERLGLVQIDAAVILAHKEPSEQNPDIKQSSLFRSVADFASVAGETVTYNDINCRVTSYGAAFAKCCLT